MAESERRQYGRIEVEAYPEYAIAAFSAECLRRPTTTPKELEELLGNAIAERAREGYGRLSTPILTSTSDEALIALFGQLGFTPRCCGFVFECDLVRARQVEVRAQPLLPAGIEARDLGGLPSDAVSDAFAQCFPGEDAQATVGLLLGSGSFLPWASSCATAGDRVVAFTMVSARTSAEAYLWYQGTVPEWRRRGVGRYLVRRTIEALHKRGFTWLVADQVTAGNDGEIRLLTTCGFRHVADQVRLSRNLGQK